MQIAPSQLSRSQWDAAIGPAALQHGWAYGAVAARFGATVRRYEIGAGGWAQVICRRIAGLWMGYLPLGIHWTGAPQAGALAELRRALAAHGPTVLVAPGPSPRGFDLRLAGPRQMAVLDLLADAAAQRARLDKKWRNRLAHAERGGLCCECVPGIPGWLVAVERRQQRARRYGNLPPAWIETWARVAPDAAVTLVASRDGVPVAAMAFLLHGAAATYLIGWSGDEGRRSSAHNLTLWHATEALRARGVRRLDLGQLDPRAQPGLARFKLGSGAMTVTVPPCRAVGPWNRSAPQADLAACGAVPQSAQPFQRTSPGQPIR